MPSILDSYNRELQGDLCVCSLQNWILRLTGKYQLEKALDEGLPPGTQETTKANFNCYEKLVMTKTNVEERDTTFLLKLPDRTGFEMRILKKKLLEDEVYSFMLH